MALELHEVSRACWSSRRGQGESGVRAGGARGEKAFSLWWRGVSGQSETRLRSRAARVAILALAVGLGLVAMHSGAPGREHADGGGHAVPMEAGHDGLHVPACDGCSPHGETTALCAVLLVAAAGSLAARVGRRLLAQARLVHVATAGALSALLAATSMPAGPPDRHALQVMRC